MIDWEEIIRTESTEELKEAKLWLFQENMRLQQERTELEQAKDKFLEERVTGCFEPSYGYGTKTSERRKSVF